MAPAGSRHSTRRRRRQSAPGSTTVVRVADGAVDRDVEDRRGAWPRRLSGSTASAKSRLVGADHDRPEVGARADEADRPAGDDLPVPAERRRGCRRSAGPTAPTGRYTMPSRADGGRRRASTPQPGDSGRTCALPRQRRRASRYGQPAMTRAGRRRCRRRRVSPSVLADHVGRPVRRRRAAPSAGSAGPAPLHAQAPPTGRSPGPASSASVGVDGRGGGSTSPRPRSTSGRRGRRDRRRGRTGRRRSGPASRHARRPGRRP